MKTIVFVASYAKSYVKVMAIAVAAMLGLVGVQLVAPAIVRQLVALVQTEVWTDPSAQRAVVTLSLALLGIYAFRTVFRFLANYMSHVAGWAVVADARRDIYHHLQKLSLGFYEEQQTGQLMSRMINDSEMFERLISHAIPDTLVNILMLFGVAAVLMSMNSMLMVLTLIPVPLILLAMRGFNKYVRPAFRERQAELANLNATLNDNLSGIREIKAFTREEVEAVRMSNRIDRYRDSMLKVLRYLAVFGPSVEFASSLGTVIVIYFGGRLAFQQVLPLEDLVAFFLYLELFYQPVRALSQVWEQVQEALAGADRVSELLEVEPDVIDEPDAQDLPEPVQGHISIDKVSFSYKVGSPVLENMSLDIPANSMVALVGPTGVGKTTTAGLVPRFYDVTAGAVRIDGHDVRKVTAASLRKNISVVLQDVFLFHGTVRDNILFGRPDASEEDVIEAARVANAHQFILDLPDGYDTFIGERGVRLSGGQKQRLSIARAVLKDAPILILDEATSSVDTETELLIQQALERLMEGRTTIVIAHRLSTVARADNIVVMEGNGIREQGRHEELIKRRGLYHSLWNVQNRTLAQLDGLAVAS